MKVALLAESMIDYAFAYASAVAGSCRTLLLTPDRLLAPYRLDLPGGLEAPVVDWPRPREPRNALFLASLLGHVRSWRPDVVHVVSQSLTWPALALPLRGRLPLVETVHDVAPHPGDEESARTPETFNRLLRAQADGMVVHSEGLRAAAAARFRRPESQVHVLPHVALTRYPDLAAKQRPLPKEDRFDVLFFGRVYRYKGLDHLIAAAEALARRIPNVRVTIAGAGSDWGRCRALIRTYGLFDLRERFIPDEEAAALLARADVVALPYIEASQSGVIAAAMAMGKPVVATDVGDFAETVAGAEPCGLITPPGDPAALADALMRLHGDPDLRARLGQAGLAQAQGLRSPAAVGVRAAEIYGAILDAHARRP